MNALLLAQIALCFLLSTNSFANNTQTITLKDGSQIKGELMDVSDGTYTIKTPTMGNVNISSNDVISIAGDGVALSAPNPAPVTQPSTVPLAQNAQNIDALQTQLMSDPTFMAEMQTMMQDPEMMQLLSDPAVLAAVSSKDPQALANSPGGQALMNNPKMKALVEKLQQK